MTTGRRSLRWRGAIACAAAVCLLAGCSPDSPEPVFTPLTQAPSPTPTPSPTDNPAIAVAEAAILEAYQGYWAAMVVSLADPTLAPDPNLAQFAIENALDEAQATVNSMRANHIAFVGAPILTPVVSDIVLSAQPTGDITDCLDVTTWEPIYVDTGASASAPDRRLRVPLESTAHFYDGRWAIRSAIIDWAGTC